MFDLIIIGGGPAGIAAGVYASRKQLNTLFITKEWGGQSIVSDVAGGKLCFNSAGVSLHAPTTAVDVSARC